MLDLKNFMKFANSPIDESAVIYLGDKQNIKIFLRNRHDDGRSGNIIRHATSVKIKCGNSKEISIRIPAESYYSDSVKSVTKDSIKQIDSTKELKDYKKFIKSFIYDNQAAIIALWYADTMSNEELAAFQKYFDDKVAQNVFMYNKGNIKPKTDSQLNADRIELVEYLRKELNDPKFTL